METGIPGEKPVQAKLSGDFVVKLFTTLISCHSVVIKSFCVIKLYYLGNYRAMAVNCRGKMFYNIGPWWQTFRCSTLG